MTGADLRELVSDAVLHLACVEGPVPSVTGPTGVGAPGPAPVTTELLVRLALERRQRPVPGLYL
jgi:hypothetical protein